MKYPEFNLKEALAGEPVVLRNGMKAYIRHHETQFVVKYPLVGIVCDSPCEFYDYWCENGRHIKSDETSCDIIGMWREPLEFKHWDALLPEIKFIAKNENGAWLCHLSKPELLEGLGLWGGSGYYRINGLADLPDVDWRHSLIERP